MIDQNETQVVIERTINADVAAVFEILADPRRHVEIDGSGTVRAANDGAPITDVGQMFTMSMSHPRIGDYTTENYIVEFDSGRRITWETTRPGAAPRGFRWGWRSARLRRIAPSSFTPTTGRGSQTRKSWLECDFLSSARRT